MIESFGTSQIMIKDTKNNEMNPGMNSLSPFRTNMFETGLISGGKQNGLESSMNGKKLYIFIDIYQFYETTPNNV
jgi:hypothetical protein